MSNPKVEQRRKAHAFAATLLAGGLTAEKRAQFDAAMADVDRLGEEIKAEQRGYSAVTYRTADKNERRREEAFELFIRNGKESITAEQRSLLERRDINEGGNQLGHIGTYSGMGFFVPTGFRDAVEQATKWFAPLMEEGVFTILNTSSGAALPMPVSNDTAQAATIVSEAGSVSESDTTSAHVLLSSYKLSSGLVKASVELIQDSAFDISDYLAKRFGERYGRGLEGYLTNGTGGGTQPTGLLPAIQASGVTPVTAGGSSESTGGAQTGANSIGYSDLVNLEHSVDPSYRRNAKYMFHDLTLASIKKIIDKFGRPLWAPGISVSEPDTINGYEYVINQSMPQIGASNVTVAFGDMSKFIVRKVAALEVQRLNELFAQTGQVGFISFARVDSNLLDAGTHPINCLQQHS